MISNATRPKATRLKLHAAQHAEPAAVTFFDRLGKRKVGITRHHREISASARGKLQQARQRVAHRHDVPRDYRTGLKMDGALQLVNRMHPRRPCDRTMILAHVHPDAARDDFAPAPELARANYLDPVVAIYIDAVEPAASEQPPDRGQMGEQ